MIPFSSVLYVKSTFELVVCRMHTNNKNLIKDVSSLEKVGEVWPWGQA